MNVFRFGVFRYLVAGSGTCCYAMSRQILPLVFSIIHDRRNFGAQRVLHYIWIPVLSYEYSYVLKNNKWRCNLTEHFNFI